MVAIIATKVKTRDEKMIDAINAPVNLDINVEIKLPRSNQTVDKKYKCTCCGASWDSQKSHFSKSASPLYQSNDGYLNICNSCRDAYYYRLVDLYNGNEAHAIRHFCQQFDIIFNEDALTASRQISADRSRISHYQAKKNLGQTARIGSTYIDGIKYDYQNKLGDVIESREQAKSEDSTITASAIDRWGVGFTEADYKNLDEQKYTMVSVITHGNLYLISKTQSVTGLVGKKVGVMGGENKVPDLTLKVILKKNGLKYKSII
jgi:hypothetical protein